MRFFLAAAIAALPFAGSAAVLDGWEPTCTNFNETLGGQAKVDDKLVFFSRAGAYVGIIRGYNLALGTAEMAVTVDELRLICANDSETDFQTALLRALMSN